VQFSPGTNDGKQRATAVRLRDTPDPERLRQRTLTVQSVSPSHCVAVDDQSGVRVHVPRQRLADEGQWGQLGGGSRMKADLEPSPQDGFSVAPGAVVLP
jgi:hypothetical protein